MALFFTAFMLPFFGSISNADALGSYACFNKDRKTHVDCLRGKLEKTPHGLTVPRGSRGLGNYGCGVPNRKAHINCLRGLLDQHGPHMPPTGGEHHDQDTTHPGDEMHEPNLPPLGGGGPGPFMPGGEEDHDPDKPTPGGDDQFGGNAGGSGRISQCTMMHPGGPSRHVDPPEALIETITSEYERRCSTTHLCAPEQLLSLESYTLLRRTGGHTPPEVDCYLREGRANNPVRNP